MRIKAIVILLFIAVATLNAQKIGLRAGVDLNTSNIRFNTIDASVRTGFHVGAISDFNLPLTGFTLNTGLLYVYDGFTVKYKSSGNTGTTFYFNNNSLQVPLNIRKHFELLGVQSFVQGGGYASYLFAGRIKDGTTSKMEFKDSKDRFNLGVNLGLGANIIPNIRVVANYNLGINDRKLPFGDAAVISYKNNNATFSVEYTF